MGSGDLPVLLLDGSADVGLLYLSEARELDPERVCTIELPPEYGMHQHIRFVIAALTPLGRPFVQWLLGPAAQSHLLNAGFSTTAGGADGAELLFANG